MSMHWPRHIRVHLRPRRQPHCRRHHQPVIDFYGRGASRDKWRADPIRLDAPTLHEHPLMQLRAVWLRGAPCRRCSDSVGPRRIRLRVNSGTRVGRIDGVAALVCTRSAPNRSHRHQPVTYWRAAALTFDRKCCRSQSGARYLLALAPEATQQHARNHICVNVTATVAPANPRAPPVGASNYSLTVPSMAAHNNRRALACGNNLAL